MKVSLDLMYKKTAASFMILALSLSVEATSIEVLNDGGFETTVSPQGSQTSWTPSDYGSWAVGDPMSTVSSESGITPLEGNKMLRFGTSGGSSSDLYQIVDVSGYASQIDAGLVTADMSVFFNAASANSSMGLRLVSWDFAPTSFAGVSILGGDYNNLSADGDLATWEQFFVDGIALTAGVRYLGFGIHEPTASPLAYADNASLQLNIASVAEPSIVILMIFGFFGFGLLKGKRSVS